MQNVKRLFWNDSESTAKLSDIRGHGASVSDFQKGTPTRVLTTESAVSADPGYGIVLTSAVLTTNISNDNKIPRRLSRNLTSSRNQLSTATAPSNQLRMADRKKRYTLESARQGNGQEIIQRQSSHDVSLAKAYLCCYSTKTKSSGCQIF